MAFRLPVLCSAICALLAPLPAAADPVSGGSAETILFVAGFDSEAEAKWTFAKTEKWGRVTTGTLEGAGAMHVQGDPRGWVQRAHANLDKPIPPDSIVTLSGWIRTQGAGYRRDEMARIVLSGNGINAMARQFRRDSEYTYVEAVYHLPAGMPKPRVTLEYTGIGGEGWFDSVQVRIGRASELPFEVEPERVAEAEPWTADAQFRVVGAFDSEQGGEPAWADLDFARLLLAAGLREPIDPASVRVVALPAGGAAQPTPAILDNALANLNDHYDRNGTVKWRLTPGVRRYAIYFDAAQAPTGPLPPAEPTMLGVGELIHYERDELNLAWLGWPGSGVAVADVDQDGDFDLYGKTVDAGHWLLRNVGSNAEPEFLPRAKPLPGDLPPALYPAHDSLDWDGNGRIDRYDIRRHPYGQGRYIDGVAATIVFNLSLAEDKRTTAPLVDAQGEEIRLLNAAWHELRPGDFDNDGRTDIVMGTTDGFLELLLNRGLDAEGRPVAERTCIPFNTYASWNCEGGDMAFKPFPVDWNGDGHMDIVATAWQGFVWLILNKGIEGKAELEDPRLLMQRGGVLAQGDSPTPHVVDWDGDGKLDLIVAGVSGQIMLFRNTGTPQQPKFKGARYLRNDRDEPIYITTVGSGIDPIQGITETYWGYLSVVGVDVDHDGDLDLILNDSLGRLRWVENTGTRTQPLLSSEFREFDSDGKGPIRTPWRNSPGVADWDGDGRLDLFVLNMQGQLVRYRQLADASGAKFGPAELQLDPQGEPLVISPERPSYRGTEGRTHISIGDIDGDGDMDLLIGRPRMVFGGGNYLLARNVGSQAAPVFEADIFQARGGRFVEWTGSDGHDDWHEVLACVADWDGDGRNDLIGGTESGRLAYYAADYFSEQPFPLFTAEAFERRDAQGAVWRVLDYASPASPRVASIVAQSAAPLQYLIDEVRWKSERAEDAEIQFILPPGDQPLSGALPLEVRVKGVSPSSIEFLIDGQHLATELTPPYFAFGDNAKWDTANHANGEHELAVKVVLRNGKILEAKQTIRIEN